MSRSTGRVARPSAPQEPAAASALELLSKLTRLPSVEACARDALIWMRDRGLLERGLVALADGSRGRLRAVGALGLSESALSEIEVGLDAIEHPLVLALNESERLPAAGTNASPETVSYRLGGRSFHVVPLRAFQGSAAVAVGLLLMAGEPPNGDASVAPLLDALALCLLGFDGAGHRERAERLERRVRMLEGILHAVPDPVIATDALGRTLAANRRAESLFTTEEMDSEGRQRAVALNNMLFSAAVFTDADLLGDAPRELLLVDPLEGRDLLFEPLRTRLSEPAGERGSVVSVLRDITDLRLATHEIEENFRKLKLAETRVRGERDRLDLIINSVADPVLVTNPDGQIVLLNAPAERLFGTPRSGRDKRAERAARSNDAVLASFVFKLHTSQLLRERAEFQLVDPSDGATVPVEAIGGKVVSDSGEVTAIVTTLHDRTDEVEKAHLYEQVQQHSEELKAKVMEATTELAQQNELLRRQAIELERASAMKSQFLANVSHELRTPLNAVMGYTQFLLQGGLGELSPKQRDRLGRVESNAQHLLTIINDLLDLSRIESGKLTIEREEFPVADLLDEVLAELEALIAASNSRVSVEVEPNLPHVETDRQKVKQIMVNFLSNALKFTDGGTIVLSARAEDGALVLSVTDTGIGIAKEEHERIFDEFQQVDHSRRHFKGGTGLGLPICRRLAQALGGEIQLASEPGKGSRFSLRLSDDRSDGRDHPGDGPAETRSAGVPRAAARMRRSRGGATT